jgi:GNAT superfamily N-acetyltransferase
MQTGVALETGLALAEINSPLLLEQIYSLRILTWQGKVGIPAHTTQWVDPEDGLARHLAITMRQQIIAAARLSIHATISEVPDPEGYVGVLNELPAPIGSLNRCVVHPDFRHRGLTRILDEARITAGKESGCRCLVLCATDEQRAAAIARLGFEFRGEGPSMPNGVAAGTRSLVFTLLLQL